MKLLAGKAGTRLRVYLFLLILGEENFGKKCLILN